MHACAKRTRSARSRCRKGCGFGVERERWDDASDDASTESSARGSFHPEAPEPSASACAKQLMSLPLCGKMERSSVRGRSASGARAVKTSVRPRENAYEAIDARFDGCANAGHASTASSQ